MLLTLRYDVCKYISSNQIFILVDKTFVIHGELRLSEDNNIKSHLHILILNRYHIFMTKIKLTIFEGASKLFIQLHFN